MKRNTFLISYIIIALLAGNLGNSWTVTILAMRFAFNGLAALVSLPVLASIILPFVLSYIASVRGRHIGRPKLFWFPLFAFLLSLLPWAIQLMIRPASPNSPVTEGVVFTYLFMLMSTISTQAPLVLHAICLTLGTQVRNVDTEILPRAQQT